MTSKVCDIRTEAAVGTWAEVGERVRQARVAAGLTAAELAPRVGLERTALVKIETGSRQLTALELFRLADVLGLPLGHFVSTPPAAMVSRRAALVEDADGTSKARYRIDALLEAHARDAEWLHDHGYLTVPDITSSLTTAGGGTSSLTTAGGGPGTTDEDARQAARLLRSILGIEGPIASLADACSGAGLFLLVLGEGETGASLLLDEHFGVAVVGGDAEPGRRRATAAHELGHHILQDEYHTDIGVAASRDEREQRINAFAAEFLLPRDEVRHEWAKLNTLTARERLISLAGRYRVSWSLAVTTAQHLRLVDDAERRTLAPTPLKGELLAVLGAEPLLDLRPGDTSSAWKQAVILAYREGAITGQRAVELLHGAITLGDLPDVDDFTAA